MKLAYGTYAMPTVPLEDAIPLIAEIGYEGVEICISERHGSALDQLDPERRDRLRGLLAEHGLGVPAIFFLGGIYTPDDEAHRRTRESISGCARLARDLGLPEPPVIAAGFGGSPDDWQAVRPRLIEQLRDLGEVAGRESFVLAGEAHSNGAVNSTQRVVEVLEAVGDPRVRLHFDIVHFFLGGEEIAECVPRLVPWTAHTHVTDAVRHPDGRFDPRLPGEGELDTVAYVRAMEEAGWRSYITLEISGMIWGADGYDAEAAARHCYDELSAALDAAGVERG
ncbi:MAG: sugar phosphate isomerase/epimerase family protein [Armatimonadota bacterium]|nr:sugar phosphate isomerase/epimerase family protein [Armatimonadota bacterium]